MHLFVCIYSKICTLDVSNIVYVRDMQSANFTINTYEKAHPVGLFMQSREVLCLSVAVLVVLLSFLQLVTE